MKRISFPHRTLKAKTLLLTLLAVITLGTGFAFSAKPSKAAVPTTSSVMSQLTSAISTVSGNAASLGTLEGQMDKALSDTLTVAAGQGLSAAPLPFGTISNPSGLNQESVNKFASNLLNEAVASGTIQLTKLQSIISVPEDVIEQLVTKTVQDGIAGGGINLTQLTNFNTALLPMDKVTDMVAIAVDQGVLSGVVSLSQITSVSSISGQMNGIISSALKDATASGISLSSAQQSLISSNVLSSLTSMTGSLNLSTFQNTIASQIVGVTGTGNIASIAGSLTGGTLSSFQDAVKGAAIENALSQVTSLSGTVNLATLQNTIAGGVLGTTGLGSIGGIAGSLGGITQMNFSGIVKESVISDAISAVSSIAGGMNLSSIESVIGGSVLSTTGLGNISSITGSFGLPTATAFTDFVQSGILNQASEQLLTLTSSIDISGMQSMLANSFFSSSGGILNAGPNFTSVTDLADSFTNIDVGAMTGLVKDSVVQNALGQLGDLSSLNVASVEGLLSSEISNITGSFNISGMTGAISDNISTAVGGIFDASSGLASLTDGVKGQLAGLTDLSSAFSSGMLSSLPSLTDISSTLASVQANALGMVGSITGSLTSAVGSVSSIASGVLSTSALSAGTLGTLTSSLSSVTSVAGPLASSVSSVSGSLSPVSGVAGFSSTKPFGGMSFLVVRCTCTQNYAIFFTDLAKPTAVKLPLIFQPGVTTLYLEKQIYTPGKWILGNWKPGGICKKKVKKACVKIPTAGTMTMVGTSK